MVLPLERINRKHMWHHPARQHLGESQIRTTFPGCWIGTKSHLDKNPFSNSYTLAVEGKRKLVYQVSSSNWEGAQDQSGFRRDLAACRSVIRFYDSTESFFVSSTTLYDYSNGFKHNSNPREQLRKLLATYWR